MVPLVARIAWTRPRVECMTAAIFRFLRSSRSVVVTLGILLAAACVSPRASTGEIIFLSAGNLTDALRAIAPVGVVALAMTLVIVSGGIDLSIGSTAALSGVVLARLLREWNPGFDHWIPHATMALCAALAAGFAVGLLNGSLVSWLGIQPFVITLASMIGIRGLALWLANNERIGLGVGRDAAGRFGAMFSDKLPMLGMLAALAVVFALLLDRTVLGRRIRAVGDNATAAALAGLPVGMTRVAVYALTGVLSALSGAMIAARTTTGDPNAGVAMELDAIAVVVIGGASLAGGRGSILGTVNGMLILGMVTNILGLRNVDFNLQLVLKAGIIVLAVALQRRKLRA